MTNIGRLSLALLAVAAVIPSRDAGAQIGGLIKKKVGQAAAAEAPAVPSVGEPVAFDDVLLELTPDRLARIAAGKAAGRKIAEGPTGPAAIRKQRDALDQRQGELNAKHEDAIYAWDEARRAAANCRDSILVAIADEKRASSAEEFLERNRQLALDIGQAQARGDTAEVRRLTEKFQASQQPTRADSLAAERKCGVKPPPPPVQEWLDLRERVDTLNQRLASAEQAVRDAEEQASGMNHRQLAISCERIRIYIERAEAKQRQQGFSQAELEALEQARAELKRLCGE